MTHDQTARFSVLQALAWRIVAELYRRHGSSFRLLMSSVHPGSSMDGCLLVKFQGTGTQTALRQPLMLILGGPADVRGRYVLGLDLFAGTDFVTSMLSEHPAQLIDEMDAQLRLVTPAPLPPSTDAVLGIRCIAELLESQALGRRTLRATTALKEHNGGVEIHPWVDTVHPDIATQRSAFSSSNRDSDAARAWASQFIALHFCQDGAPLWGLEAENPIAVFHLGDGTVHIVHGGESLEIIRIRQSYEQHGRTLKGLVSKVLNRIGG